MRLHAFLTWFCFFIFYFVCLFGFAGFVYQDFEFKSSGRLKPLSPPSIEDCAMSWNGQPGFESHVLHSGKTVLKFESSEQWNEVQVFFKYKIPDFIQDDNDRLIFWIYAQPEHRSDNNIGVKFFDNGLYSSQGATVWTSHNAFYGEWTKLAVLFTQLPPDFNLRQVQKISFVNYWPGLYYFDDIQVIREDLIYQTFEIEKRHEKQEKDLGWTWNQGDECGISIPGEPVQEGRHSWKIISKTNWGGTGIQSEYSKFIDTKGAVEQSSWHVDLNPGCNNVLTFSVYALPEDKKDYPLNVQFFDHSRHSTVDTKVMIWTQKNARYNQWTQLEIPFHSLPPTFDFHDLNKIQFQFYMPGIFYFDDIRVISKPPEFKRYDPSGKNLIWDFVEQSRHQAFNWYQLEYSPDSHDKQWKQIYRGARTFFELKENTKGLFRVRYEKLNGFKTGLPYLSEWSKELNTEG